ncbi:MAG: hypothetical protein IJ343_05530 [Clostridia bacterium]|nr:hypothetical protein [Clostridia bacterium]
MQNKKQKIEKVSKPFIRGKIVDRTLPGGALKFFAFTALMMFVYFMSIIVASMDSQLLNVLINGAILLTTWLIFWQSGMASGADAVTQGEIMYQRREKGRPVADWEADLCYHPLKGLIIALVGSIPLLLASLILACIAQRQMTTLGVLPSWMSTFETRQEIGGALAYYHVDAKLTLESVLRIVIHVATMPYVSLLGAENKDMMLLLERISPIVNLLPAVMYGAGYAMGTQERVAVHSNIALGKKKARKKQAKERKARQQTRRGPEQLN